MLARTTSTSFSICLPRKRKNLSPCLTFLTRKASPSLCLLPWTFSTKKHKLSLAKLVSLMTKQLQRRCLSMLRRDSKKMKHLQNNKITKFLLISFLISWGFGWGLLAFLTQMSLLSLTSPLGVFLHLLGGFGPTIAAISCLPQKSIKSIVSFILGDSKKYILLFLLLIFVQTGNGCNGWTETS